MDLRTIEETLSRLQPKKYERRSFPMQKPSMLDIQKELQQFAQITKPIEEINQFVIDNAPLVLRERLRSYEAAQVLFGSIEDLKETEQNKVYYREYIEEKNRLEHEKEVMSRPYDPESDLPRFQLPPISLLNRPTVNNRQSIDYESLVTSTFELQGFSINSVFSKISRSYSYTTLSLSNQANLIKIRKKAEDIESNLHPCSRVVAPIPGTMQVGVEIPLDGSPLPLKYVFDSNVWKNNSSILPIALGENTDGEVDIIDLSVIGNLLVMGRDNQQLSVVVESLVASLLFHVHPSKLAFAILDSSGFVYNEWRALSNLYLCADSNGSPAIVQSGSDFSAIISDLYREVIMRLALFGNAMVRDIRSYNERFCSRTLHSKLIDVQDQNPSKHHYLKDIVVIIDNISGIIDSQDPELIKTIQLIANRAKDTGVHLICVADGVSRKHAFGNLLDFMNHRLLLKLSERDSYSMLSCNDCARLSEKYDAIYTDGFNTQRIYTPEIQTSELQCVFDHFAIQQQYSGNGLKLPSVKTDDYVDMRHLDPLFEDCAELVIATAQGSTSMLQRKFCIGYTRAGHIMDQMEAAGIVGPYSGSKARAVLVSTVAELKQILSDLKNRY